MQQPLAKQPEDCRSHLHHGQNRCDCFVACCRTLGYSHPPQKACFEDRNDHFTGECRGGRSSSFKHGRRQEESHIVAEARPRRPPSRIPRRRSRRSPRRKPRRGGRRSSPPVFMAHVPMGPHAYKSRASCEPLFSMQKLSVTPPRSLLTGRGSACLLPQNGAFHFGDLPIRLVLRSHISTKARSPSPPATRIPGRSCLKLSDICCAPPSALRPVDEVRQEPVPLCAIFLV